MISNPSLGAATLALNLNPFIAEKPELPSFLQYTVSPTWKGILFVLGSVDVSLVNPITLGVINFLGSAIPSKNAKNLVLGFSFWQSNSIFLERINWICSTETTLLPKDFCSITGVTLYLIPVLVCFLVVVLVVVIVLTLDLFVLLLQPPTFVVVLVPVHVVFHEFHWTGEKPFWSALYCLTVVKKLPSTTGPLTGLIVLVSTQLSFSGYNSISPT